ncbi:recombinase RecT [Mariniphaga sediminis]|uniref:recombinase RecT n=1 Tax=Mariniphaga sediminis TaxID=1628158 RepID=UPI0035687FFC
MTTNAPAKKPVSNLAKLKSVLAAPSVEEQFRNALKENSGAFVASVIDLYNGDTRLQQCDPNEVVMEALKAATLKLPINRNLGFSWIIPYNNSVKTDNGWEKVLQPQFQLGYKGYIQLAMRTGQYKFINTDAVYEGELQRLNKLTGEIAFDGEKKSDNVVGYFAYFELLNGFSKSMYSTVEQIEAHAKQYSPSYNSKNTPWKSDFPGMAMKTVLKDLLSKYGYLSVEMMDAMASDEQPDYSGRTLESQPDKNSHEISIDEAQVVNDEQKKAQKMTFASIDDAKKFLVEDCGTAEEFLTDDNRIKNVAKEYGFEIEIKAVKGPGF